MKQLHLCFSCGEPAQKIDPRTGLRWCTKHSGKGCIKNLDIMCNAQECGKEAVHTIGIMRYCDEHHASTTARLAHADKARYMLTMEQQQYFEDFISDETPTIQAVIDGYIAFNQELVQAYAELKARIGNEGGVCRASQTPNDGEVSQVEQVDLPNDR